jgi:hypothetical protein
VGTGRAAWSCLFRSRGIRVQVSMLCNAVEAQRQSGMILGHARPASTANAPTRACRLDTANTSRQGRRPTSASQKSRDATHPSAMFVTRVQTPSIIYFFRFRSLGAEQNAAVTWHQLPKPCRRRPVPNIRNWRGGEGVAGPPLAISLCGRDCPIGDRANSASSVSPTQGDFTLHWLIQS